MIKRKKILIIDDSEEWFYYLNRVLKNHDVHWALSIIQAERMVRVIKYDLVICDYMGITIDGKPPKLEFLKGKKHIVSSGMILQKKIKNFVPKDEIIKWFLDNKYIIEE